MSPGSPSSRTRVFFAWIFLGASSCIIRATWPCPSPFGPSRDRLHILHPRLDSIWIDKSRGQVAAGLMRCEPIPCGPNVFSVVNGMEETANKDRIGVVAQEMSPHVQSTSGFRRCDVDTGIRTGRVMKPRGMRCECRLDGEEPRLSMRCSRNAAASKMADGGCTRKNFWAQRRLNAGIVLRSGDAPSSAPGGFVA
ncbi:hypothetical protein B0H15DRAFT_810129 [Mycena belliarum]|uniref:Uncharacterized protein n=1 Tax=Mycena belliarum TaxID=1033014 RepID=A0AAD6Y2H2_9AGAR|nr:hypothetical protein B0H15DRAFT_810129 [Mycena belliae]